MGGKDGEKEVHPFTSITVFNNKFNFFYLNHSRELGDCSLDIWTRLSTFYNKVDYLCVFFPLNHLEKFYWESVISDIAPGPRAANACGI